MKIIGWLLSRCDPHPNDDGTVKPIVASMSVAWYGPMQPLHPEGWMLVQIRCDAAQLEFIKTDEDFIWIGNEWSKVPTELIGSYAEMLDSNEDYLFLGQVLDKLGERETRFLHSLAEK